MRKAGRVDDKRKIGGDVLFKVRTLWGLPSGMRQDAGTGACVGVFPLDLHRGIYWLGTRIAGKMAGNVVLCG